MTTVLVEGIHFGEGPRWHDGRLWFSDFYAGSVRAVTPEGEVEVVVEMEGQPSGLGWLPDGRLLLVSMLDRRLLRREPTGELVEHADLSSVATGHCNDMVVDADGRAYVGNFGDEGGTAAMALVTSDGTVTTAAADLRFPNGTIISDDGRTLVVAETYGRRLTAFDRDPATGTLANRRVWADLRPEGDLYPDGICLDADGAIWVAAAVRPEVVRVAEGGVVLARISVSQNSYACMLGGDDGRQLFVLTAPGSDPAAVAGKGDGRREVVAVDVPRAGRP